MTHQLVATPAPFTDRPGPARQGARAYILLGFLVLIIMLGGLATWAFNARIAGAVIAAGSVKVESNRKSVQHLEGGIVGELHVTEGDAVAAGALLLRLDDTIDRATMALVTDQLTELTAQKARLTAEISDAETVIFPPEWRDASIPAKHRDIWQGQQQYFSARKTARENEEKITRQRIKSLRLEIEGLSQQVAARDRQIDLLGRELAGARKLHEKGLVTVTRILELERAEQNIAARKAEHATAIARAKAGIGELELELVQAGSRFREQATAALRSIQVQILSLTERRVAAAQRLANTEIRAPQAGTVHGLNIHTVGGVIKAGEPIMQIVPSQDRLVIEAHIPVNEIDNVYVGQQSRLQFAAFDANQTPQVPGTVIDVSRDTFNDAGNNQYFYRAIIRIEDADTLKLIPGMAVNAFIETASRPVIAYLLKPLKDSFNRAFRDA